MTQVTDAERAAQRSERWALLATIDRMLEGPLVLLSFVWLGLLVAEFVVGVNGALDLPFYAIWVVFIIEVVIELLIAPDRGAYLRGNWLKVVSLVLPAFRLLRVVSAFRFLRAARAIRSAGLLRLLTSMNRGMGALARTLDRTRFVYVVALTVLVIALGAAGMLYLERPSLPTYGEALWWTAMTMTTVGTDYFPASGEGRVLAWLLSVYAIGVFGYVTATMASHFLGLGAGRPSEQDAGALAAELAAVRAELAAVNRRLGEQQR